MHRSLSSVCLALALACVTGGGIVSPSAANEQVSPLTPQLQAPRQAKLTTLFAALKAAPDKARGAAIVADIWDTWLRTGDDDLDLLMRRAQTFMRSGQPEQAYQALDQLIARAPNYAEGWNRRATLNYMMGRHADSVRDIQKTLEREPRHFGALSGLGMIYMSRKNWGAALKAFELAAEINPWLDNKESLLSMLKERAAGEPL